MTGQRRRRLDAGTWREVLERFATADLTVDKFCDRERLSPSSFYRWRERLQVAGTLVAAPRPPSARGVAVRTNTAEFIDLGSLAGPSRSAEGGLELRLELGGGVVLQITRR